LDLKFPEPEKGDLAEVVSALETGLGLWKKGERLDAIRWLQKAALKASQCGQMRRAGVLAGAAGQLNSQLKGIPMASPDRKTQAHFDSDFSDTTIVDRAPQPVAVPGAPLAAPKQPRQSLRVAVERSKTEPDVLLVKVLEDGQSTPPGAHEALLVALEAGADLLKPKK
jgi:hypothetical protein